MKRATLWVVGAGVASVALMLALRAQEQQAQKTATTASPVAANSASGPGTVAFTFSSDEQMAQFAQLWQQRQGVLTRMAVLQDYWNLEQNGLTEANRQLLATYNLDVNKIYTLDTDRKVLIEREAVPAPPAQLGEGQPAVTQPATPSQP